MRITSKGQVTIPIAIREQAGLLPNTEVTFEYDGSAVKIVKVPEKDEHGRGGEVLRRLRGRATSGLSTDEIMALTRVS